LYFIQYIGIMSLEQYVNKINMRINDMYNIDIKTLQYNVENLSYDINDNTYVVCKENLNNNIDKLLLSLHQIQLHLYDMQKKINHNENEVTIKNCDHKFEKVYPSGVRDNGEYDLICIKCNKYY